MIIDVFCHHISKSVGQMMSKAKYYREGIDPDTGCTKEFIYPMQNADPEVRLGLMDKYRIDIQALSQSAPVLLGFDSENAAEICRLSNSDNYTLCKKYPDRFINICIISLLNMRSTMEELGRSINELDCRGVTIATNQNGKGLDSPEYFPFYEKMVEYDLPLFLHPTHWESYPLIDKDKMMVVFGWPFDTTQAVWRLIFGGVIDRFPSLRIVMHHMGAMLPYFAGRIETMVNRAMKGKLPRPISEYWGNIYGDTAIDGKVSAFPCGYAFLGPDRMLFGTDYPFGTEGGENFIRSNLVGVRSMNIPIENMEKILAGNAKKLLKIR